MLVASCSFYHDVDDTHDLHTLSSICAKRVLCGSHVRPCRVSPVFVQRFFADDRESGTCIYFHQKRLPISLYLGNDRIWTCSRHTEHVVCRSSAFRWDTVLYRWRQLMSAVSFSAFCFAKQLLVMCPSL